MIESTIIKKMKMLYNNKLAKEWIDWVEMPNPEGTREKEIFPSMKDWLKKVKPRTIADIGCGQGSCSELITNKVKYIGIDPSLILIKRAKKLYPSTNKSFIKGSAYNISLRKESVDALISIWAWSHLDNLELAAKEMYRILKPRGRFLIITANPETYEERKTFYIKYSIKDNLLIGTFDLGNGKVLTNTTLYLHTKKEIKDAIKKAGLSVSYTKGMGKTKSNNKGLYLIIEGLK